MEYFENFDKYDTNNNDQIEADELEQAWKNNDFDYDDQSLRDRITEGDTDKSGAIDQDEFINSDFDYY